MKTDTMLHIKDISKLYIVTLLPCVHTNTFVSQWYFSQGQAVYVPENFTNSSTTYPNTQCSGDKRLAATSQITLPPLSSKAQSCYCILLSTLVNARFLLRQGLQYSRFQVHYIAKDKMTFMFWSLSLLHLARIILLGLKAQTIAPNCIWSRRQHLGLPAP